MGTLTGFFEDMSGTSKQKYGPDLFDEENYKKWKERQEAIYGKIGAAGDRYGRQADRFLGLYGEDRGEADRYRGLAETEFGRSRAEIERARETFGRAKGDVQAARDQQLKATELMSDRDHYANLKRRSMARDKAGENARKQLASLRAKMGKPSRDTGFTQSLMDAFKRTTASNRKIIDANARDLARGGNKVAAADMVNRYNQDSLLSLGRLKQQGTFTDEQLKNSRLTQEQGMLMNETSLISMGATEDQISNAVHSGQIRDRLNAGSGALNIAAATGNIGRNYLSGADRYAALGQQYGGMGSDLDRRGATALNMTSRYEGLKYGTLQDRMSISNKRVASEEKKRLSDLAARRRIDSFNNQRANLGIQNTFKAIRTGVAVAGAGATGGGSLLLEAYIRGQENKNKGDGGYDPYRTDIPDTQDDYPDLRFNPNDVSNIG